MGKHVKNDQSGLYSLAIVLKMLGSPVAVAQLNHHFSSLKHPCEIMDLAQVLKELSCKVRMIKGGKIDFSKAVYPIMAQRLNGQYLVLAKYSSAESKFLVQSSSDERAHWMSKDEIQSTCKADMLSVRSSHDEDKATGNFNLGWFAKAALKYRSILFECMLASLFVQFFALLSPIVFMIVIDKVLTNNSLSTLDVLVFALIVVSLFEILLNSIRTYLLSHTASRIDLVLGLRLFKHLMSIPLSYFESRKVGDTISRVRELDNVRQFITGSGVTLFLDLLFVVVFLFVMFLFSPFLSIIVIFTLPFLFAASFIITPFLRDRLEGSYSVNAENQSFLVETISGIETIKSSAAEPKIREKWEEKLTRHVKMNFHSGQWANLFQQFTAVTSKVLSVLLLWFGAKEVLQGNLTVGQLIAFNMLSSRVTAPVLRLSQVWKEFQQVNVAVARIGDIFSCTPEPGFDPQKVSLPAIKGAVDFNRVSFRYNRDGLEVLHDVSFKVRPGEVVGIVGSTGSGKTTLAKLLQRLYVPEKGRIFIDGIDLSMADASWLRRQIGVVVQDSVLFSGSIRDNIALNAPDIGIEDVMASAELAGAHTFIMQLPHGYDTEVGERGLQLSAGQRQRLAIARALVKNPRMLILDEATSALDYESERIIQENMKTICSDRTVFIIAHRLSTVRHADRIITLENGAVMEDDAPDKLLEAGGKYAMLQSLSSEGCHA